MGELAVRELPLFPLPDVVLFPQEVLPLHIFEPRYRMLLRTVMAGDQRFGVVRWDPQNQTMADVGCCAEILHCQTQDDDHSNIVTMGQQRFRVLDIVREAPFRVGMVSWIEDEPETSHAELAALAGDVGQALRGLDGGGQGAHHPVVGDDQAATVRGRNTRVGDGDQVFHQRARDGARAGRRVYRVPRDRAWASELEGHLADLPRDVRAEQLAE